MVRARYPRCFVAAPTLRLPLRRRGDGQRSCSEALPAHRRRRDDQFEIAQGAPSASRLHPADDRQHRAGRRRNRAGFRRQRPRDAIDHVRAASGRQRITPAMRVSSRYGLRPWRSCSITLPGATLPSFSASAVPSSAPYGHRLRVRRHDQDNADPAQTVLHGPGRARGRNPHRGERSGNSSRSLARHRRAGDASSSLCARETALPSTTGLIRRHVRPARGLESAMPRNRAGVAECGRPGGRILSPTPALAGGGAPRSRRVRVSSRTDLRPAALGQPARKTTQIAQDARRHPRGLARTGGATSTADA